MSQAEAASENATVEDDAVGVDKAAALILVTGATGYLATHILQQLLVAGHHVRATVRDLHCSEKMESLRKLCPNSKYPLSIIEAELLTPALWLPAIQGCTYVIHTASPFPPKDPKNEDEIIKPAVDGTLNVLQACRDSKSVKRVVLTSSIAAISGGFENGKEKAYTEEDWPNADDLSPYAKSKLLAEKAAWQFVNDLPANEKFELCVMNPVMIGGPVLCSGFATSLEFPKRLLERQMPLVPALNLPYVDVRDVAAAHIVALTATDVAGHRHILHGHNIWVSEMANMLSKEFQSQGYNVPTGTAPYWILWLNSLIDSTITLILKSIGQVTLVDNTRMRTVLGIQPRDIRTTIMDMSYSMIDNGMIKKTAKYRGRPSDENAS